MSAKVGSDGIIFEEGAGERFRGNSCATDGESTDKCEFNTGGRRELVIEDDEGGDSVVVNGWDWGSGMEECPPLLRSVKVFPYNDAIYKNKSRYFSYKFSQIVIKSSTYL